MIKKILYPSRDLSRPFTSYSGTIVLAVWISLSQVELAHAEEGATLHAENCIACHAAMTGGEGSVLYTREDRVVKSLDALTKQVNRCQSSLGLDWSNEKITAVQKFLNATFYKF